MFAADPPPHAPDASEEDFYGRLPILEDLKQLSEPERFTPAPASWCVVVADVVDSTEAIEAGRYKDVNVVGALSIVAMLNMAGQIDIPYTFGGDGALLLVPETLRADAEDVLINVRRRAKRDFGLELRAGIVPIADLYATGEQLTVARWQASPHYVQGLFLGGGLACAERMVKDPERAARYQISRTDGVFEADYTGFSCRWREIPSPYAESVCLLVQASATENPGAVYKALLAKIELFYGDARRRHPITAANLRPALRDSDLEAEAKVAVPGTDAAAIKARKKYTWKTRLEVLFTNLWMTLETRTSARRTKRWFPRMDADAPDAEPMDWGKYKEFLIETSDIQKLDGALRLVMSGYPVQRTHLTEFLEAEYRAGRIAYGLHASTGALMTCLVYQPNGRQVHFVDGADGGYALAARALKGRLAALEAGEAAYAGTVQQTGRTLAQ